MQLFRSLITAGITLGLGIAASGSLAAAETPAVSSGTVAEVAVSTDAAGPDTRTNIEKLADPYPNVRRNAVIYLGSEKKKEYVAPLTAMLQDDNTEVRRAAINALANIGDRASAAVLQERFAVENNLSVKITLIAALGELKAKTSLPLLRSLLKDPYPGFRNEAVRSLARFKASETYPEIVGMLADEAEGVRLSAIEAAEKLKITSAADGIAENLQNPFPKIRLAAARALGTLGGEPAKAALEKIANDPEPAVAAEVQRSIESIDRRTAEKAAAQPSPSGAARKK